MTVFVDPVYRGPDWPVSDVDLEEYESIPQEFSEEEGEVKLTTEACKVITDASLNGEGTGAEIVEAISELLNPEDHYSFRMEFWKDKS